MIKYSFSDGTELTFMIQGNAIHGAGTEAISKVLRRNQTLQK